MSIENLPTFPADKANHYIYGSFAAATGASLALWLMRGSSVMFVVAAAAAVIAAGAVGVWKEYRDARANDAAAADGEPPAHDASKADARATAKGSIPVVAVLVVLQLLAVV